MSFVRVGYACFMKTSGTKLNKVNSRAVVK